MEIITIKTRPLLPPQDNLFPILDEVLTDLKERDVICITSKVLAIHQGRSIPISDVANKDDLIIQEAEKYIDRSEVPNGYTLLTIKEQTLIASSGIDESNSNGYYVLWPTECDQLLAEICNYLKNKHGIKELGVIATDSHTLPLRRGVTGIATGFFGINPLNDYRGKPDIFGRALKMTQTDVVDSLAAMAVFHMGEGSEQTPIVVLRDLEHVTFSEDNHRSQFNIPLHDDIYFPLLKVFKDKDKVDPAKSLPRAKAA